MKKRYLAIALALLCKCSVWAQELKVISFEADPFDMTAQQANKKDGNGETCALVKVQILSDKVRFDGDIVGQPQHNQNEYHVYLVPECQRLSISTDNTMPSDIEFGDYGIEELKGGCTYILKLEMPEKAPGAIFEIGMPDVTIVVDGEEYTTDASGGLDLSLNNGEHTYKISKSGYKTYEGTIVVDKIPAIRKIEMQRGDGLQNKGLLSFTYPLNSEFTIVPVNALSQPPSKSVIATGEQIALNGTYQIRFNKKKYVPKTIAVTVTPGDDIKMALSGIALEADKRLESNDYSKAFKDYRKLANKGDDLAQYKLGCFYFEGKGTSADRSLAMNYWENAAKQGNMDAYRKLVENETDAEKKLKWIQKLAENGDGESMVALAYIYEKNKDWERMKQWLQKACAMDYPKAHYQMGEIYYEGKGCEQNYSKAYKYYKVAVARDYVLAKERLLDYLYLGLADIKQNKKEAVDGYLNLGGQLSDDGKYKIGMYYYEEYEKNSDNKMLDLAKSSFTSIDPTSSNVHWTAKAQDVFWRLAKSEAGDNAVHYYRLCETAGRQSAQLFTKLGDAYRLGKGVNASPSTAYTYYSKASEMNDKDGICWLGFCYEKGIGVTRDLSQAVKLYQHAEQMGSKLASGYLGTMYAQGAGGLSKDMATALKKWTDAAKNGHKSSIRNLIKYYKSKKNSKEETYWNKMLQNVLADEDND